MQYICLKTDSYNFSYIEDVFKNLLGNFIHCELKDNYLFIHHKEFNIEELTDIIQALEIDLDSPISVYLSYNSNEEALKYEWSIVNELFDKSGYGIYVLKDLLEINKFINNSSDILKFVLEGTGVDRNVLEAMATCDLNVSKASNVLYMHRNTLIYKIDKLLEKSGFDIRTFKDLFTLYKLIGV
jgi:sugar diacid utilization regulator